MRLNNSTVLVTGGTGSFGKAFIKKLLDGSWDNQRMSHVRKVIVFSRDELKQYEMQQEFTDGRVRFFLGDVRDKDRLYRAFDGVDIVIHAAALKQVPAAEYNPMEFIKTNILGASNVIDAAIDRGVERVLALSTDKAVNPVNLYGATKLCSDKLFVAANSYSGHHDTRFSVVRWGNVAGSRGSVIPFFTKLRGQKVPITHPDMTRFFITLDDATRFALGRIESMQGGEIFVPKMPSMKITDLATAIGCPYEIVGIRPGEKLHEALISEDEARSTREADTHFVISSSDSYGEVVPHEFRYTSDTNPDWLSVPDLESVLQRL